MTFRHAYLLFGLVIPCAIVGLLFLLTYALSRYFAKKGYSMPIRIAPIFFWLVAFLSSLAFLSSGYRYPLCAIFQDKSDRYLTTGYVVDVTNAPSLPIYYDSISHKWSIGKLVTVNNQQYYVPFGDVKIGSAIDLVWGSDEKVVYEYCTQATVSNDKIGTRLVSSSVETRQNSSFKKICQLVSTGCFVMFLIIAILLYATKNKIYKYLIKKDNEFIQKIIPNRIGLVECSVSSVLIFGITIGLTLSGFKEALLFCIVYICIRIASIVKTMRTELIINEDSIVVIKGKKTEKYSKNCIADVKIRPSRAQYSRCLVITFYNGQKISLEQLHFWGLSSTYLKLTKKKKTGDGLREP